METSRLKESLTQLLANHNAPNVRYRGLALSTNAPTDLLLITQTLQILLPDYTLWESGQNCAPELPCHRTSFIEQAFEVSKTGLIISDCNKFWGHPPTPRTRVEPNIIRHFALIFLFWDFPLCTGGCVRGVRGVSPKFVIIRKI
ncbi:hypothetical protein [Candidatus Parabeggiatoa sp. HSG14]|uniref:hypothetical protein n=1 Tax=Candidatus Parabeggiatoa sp. HSG14 TaxID=3055593 RepID=UPI0025A7D9D9|nr:hypothetical protein [Thiotrichales bacterium HSG14]